jgi:membrane-associated protein
MIDVDLDALADLGALAYLLVFAFAAFDVIFPVLPSEATVILAATLASQGKLNPWAIAGAAAVGAVSGDHLSYGIGRWSRRAGTPRPGGKVARLQGWAAQQLAFRGPVILLVARFIPGGRTASTLTSGRLRYPLRRFTPVICIAGPLWAAFGTALGYLGGATFHDRTLLATAMGVGVGVGTAMLIEFVLRRLGVYGPSPREAARSDDDVAADEPSGAGQRPLEGVFDQLDEHGDD